MSILIVFYSRTNTTRKVAEMIKQKLNADIEEISTAKDCAGMVGYMTLGANASRQKTMEISPAVKDPAAYDLVIIGTPIHAWNVSSPVRSYLEQQKGKFKSVAFFSTMGGSGDDKAYATMSAIAGVEPRATLALFTKEVVKDEFAGKTEEFIKKISV